MQYSQWGAFPQSHGIAILKFLRKILKENKWEEFCDKCSKIERDLTKRPRSDEYDLLTQVLDDDENEALKKIKKAFVKDCDKDVYIAEKC